jgi:hypothetical protein
LLELEALYKTIRHMHPLWLVAVFVIGGPMTRTPKAAGSPPQLKIWQFTARISDSEHVRRVDYGVLGEDLGYFTSAECRTLGLWLSEAADWLDQQTAKRGKKTRRE